MGRPKSKIKKNKISVTISTEALKKVLKDTKLKNFQYLSNYIEDLILKAD